MRLRPDLAANLGVQQIGSRFLPGDTLPDYSEEGENERIHLVAERQQEFSTISQQGLADDELITARVLRFVLETGGYSSFPAISAHEFPLTPCPVTHMTGVHADMMALLMRDHEIQTEQDAENYLSRVNRLPDAVQQSTQRLASTTAQSIHTPACILRKAATALSAFLHADPGKNLLCRDYRHKLERADLSQATAARLQTEVESSIHKKTYPTYQKLLEQIELSLAADEQRQGIWRLAEGDRYYSWCLSKATTTAMTPGELHELGLSEIEKLQVKIRQEFGKIWMTGLSIADLYHQLEALPSSTYPKSAAGRQQLLDEAGQEVSQMRQACRELFNIWPETGVRIDPVPVEMENSTNTYYTPLGPGREGEAIFVLNVGQTMNKARWELPTLCHHEAWPGHHLQLTIAQNQSELPVLRRNMLFNAYLEGWAKYAETIPVSHGYETNPAVKLGRLRSELYSTVNLALDTGIHWKRWNRQQARAFFMDNTGATEAFADFVVDRSIVSPGELCAYKLGMIKMLGYLDRFKSVRKDRFSIQEFHDTVLQHGALPFVVMDDVVNESLGINGQ